MKNSFYIKVIFSMIMLVLLMVLSGCSVSEKQNGISNQTIEESRVKEDKVIMDEFNVLLQKDDSKVKDVFEFINKKIAAVSPQSGSIMLNALENKQKAALIKMKDTYEADVMQQKLAKDFKGDLTDSSLHGIQDRDTKELLLETKSNGFKVETAEGFYFPVLDYSLYKQYRSNVTPDIAAYIDIMAIESDITPVKDAGLMIGWEEIIKRGISQEKFVQEYHNSPKVADVKQLLKNYLIFALYGTNNTPLYQYEDKQMAPAAKEIYSNSTWSGSGSFSKIMAEYAVLVKNNNYNLTQEVDEYRKKVIQEFH